MDSGVRDKSAKMSGVVGAFIRKRREVLNLSQRSLGQLFQPPVTTQFISNVERGVTPLPPSHIGTVAKALQIAEAELVAVLEREYAVKLNGRIGCLTTTGIGGLETSPGAGLAHVVVEARDRELMQQLYEAYQRSNDDKKRTFIQFCQQTLGMNRKI